MDDCLERVLGPGDEPSSASSSAFAVVFFEGHDQAGVQDALNSFAERCRSELKGHLKSRYFVL